MAAAAAAAAAATRSILQSSSLRSSANKFVSKAKSFSSSPPKPEVDRSKSCRSKKMGKSPFSTMSPLHFHYEDVLRQDLLLKLNCANITQVPGLCEIRLLPKASASSGIATKSGKVATEILCGQRFLKAKKDPNFQGGKSGRPVSFSGPEKDAGFARQSTLRGHEMSNFVVRMLSVMSMLDSRVEVGENSIKFSMGTEFCQSSPELEDHFEFFEHVQAFNVVIATTANTKEETSLLWSGLLLNDEVEIK